MSGLRQVFHNVPKPITVNEFRDAVRAICTPRYPMARQAQLQRVGLAISGGLDSMALAFLMSKLNKVYHCMQIADNPLDPDLVGIIVDHKLRPHSSEEAKTVAASLKQLGIKPVVIPIRWDRQGLDPENVTNVESVARTLRYQAIARWYSMSALTSLFVAHHEDDQYETVLMRLLNGHGYRGLTGVRHANAIPECYDMHGVYKSGLLDNQRAHDPHLAFRPSRSRLKLLRKGLSVDSSREPWDQVKATVGMTHHDFHFSRFALKDSEHQMMGPFLPPVPCEEGGVMVYRPLLEFSKDRLRATCEANGVPWVEDLTNKDFSLTPRNAVRHLVTNHTLPKALQKPAILARSARCRRRVHLEESEAQRMLTTQATIRIFDPHVGTLLVEMPTFDNASQTGYKRSPTAKAREVVKQPRRRIIAANVVRKLIEYVTPDETLPIFQNLDQFVDILFPELSAKTDHAATPKAFSIAGTFFQPVPGATTKVWFLSRTPFPAGRKTPEVRLNAWTGRRVRVLDGRISKHSVRGSPWFGYYSLQKWDGRFWINFATSRGEYSWSLRPLEPQYMKTFKKSLGHSQRARLEEVLKYYAPGKSRYTLPALYRFLPEKGETAGNFDMARAEVVALPSLGFALPGLTQYVAWSIRYKMIDSTLLGLKKRKAREPLYGFVPNVSLSRQLRRQRQRVSRANARKVRKDM